MRVYSVLFFLLTSFFFIFFFLEFSLLCSPYPSRPTTQSEYHRNVFWDKLLLSRNESLVDSEQTSEYWIFDDNLGLLNSEISLVVGYDVVPHTGMMLPEHLHRDAYRIKMPAEYSRLQQQQG